MILGIITLLIAVLISAISAYYSVLGLTAIFAAAAGPVMIMGAALEAGKVMTAVWLHKNWKRAELQYRLYLVPAVVFLMLLTSMGVFGFLSKAHLDQSVPTGDIVAQVQILDDKINTQRENIEASRKALAQMNSTVDQIMARSTDTKGADKAAALRRSQSRERAAIQNDITLAQKEIVNLQEERAPIANQARKLEAEVGPIKYVAALLYNDTADQTILEQAVRFVIIMIVIVFDPLAIVLILAGIKHIEWERAKKANKAIYSSDDTIVGFWPTDHTAPPLDASRLDKNTVKDESSTVKEQPEEIVAEPEIETATVEADLITELEEARKTTETIAEYANSAVQALEIKENEVKTLTDALVELNSDYQKISDQNEISLQRNFELTQQLEQLQDRLENLQNERDLLFRAHSQEMARADELANASIQEHETLIEDPVVEETPKVVEPTVINELPADHEPVVIPPTQPKADFGLEFPENPARGDMFLRVDFKPSRLFKWNDTKWIEINKTTTDAYTYNDQYIQFLAEKLNSGEYSYDDLNDTEMAQVHNVKL